MNSRPKGKRKEHRKYKNEIIFEDEVAELVSKKQPIARAQLKDYLLEVHNGELGYSEKTIDRKLNQMIKTGDLVPLRFNDFPNYGIKDEDRRVVYFVLKKSLKIKEDIDEIFKDVISSDQFSQYHALEELRRHNGRYFFEPRQLDKLISHMDPSYGYLINIEVDVLCEHILGRGIEPSNKDKLLEDLRSFLKLSVVNSAEYPKLRQHVLWLLAYYKDSAVIEQLKFDLRWRRDPANIVEDYCNEFVAPLIVEHSVKLINFHINLEVNGKPEAYKTLSQIKDYACDSQNKMGSLERNMDLYDRIQKLREERIQELPGE